jgi:hypothetical protein
MDQQGTAWRVQAGVWLSYWGLTLLITFPLILDLSGQMIGFPYGDAYEVSRHVWWIKYALQTGLPVIHQPFLGWPDGMAGISLWGNPQQFFPAWALAFVMPLPVAYNLSQLFYMALNGWAMYRLGLYLCRQPWAAWVAGAVFMAAPIFQGHLAGGHPGLIMIWGVPLYLLALFRLKETGRWRWFVAAVACLLLSVGGHVLQILYVILPVSAVFVLWQALQRDWRGAGQTVLVNLTGGALMLVFLLPIMQDTLNTSAYVEEGGFVRYSADLLGVVTPSFRHPLYGHLGYTHQVLGVNLEEGSSYIGFVAGALALVGLWRVPVARRWLWLMGLAWVLSLGPLLKLLDQPVTLTVEGYESFIPLPGALLQDLPGFGLARTPGRFAYGLALAVAFCVAYGVAYLLGKVRGKGGRMALSVGLVALALLDTQMFWPLPTVPATLPQAVIDLRERGDIRAVLDLPWDDLLAGKDALYLQTGHEQPLVAGFVTRSTPVNPAKLWLLQQTLDPALLDQAGADLIIAHRAYLSEAEQARIRAALGEPFYADAALWLFDAPKVRTPLTAIQAYIPPVTQITDSASAYVYAPVGGWVDFTAHLTGNGQTVALYRDGQRWGAWTVQGETTLELALPVLADTYHTLTLALEPACPTTHHPALICDAVAVQALALGDFSVGQGASVGFEGVALVNGRIVATDAALQLDLLWRFDRPYDASWVRFVHVLNADGELVTQADAPLGEGAAGDYALESLLLDLPADLAAGTYRVYVGWYQYPGLNRLAVTGERHGAADGLGLLGDFEIPVSTE